MRWFAVAALLALAGCGPRTASRGVMGVSWIRSAAPPPDHGFQAFAEYHSEIGGARDDADRCGLAALVVTGAALGIRDRPILNGTDEPIGVMRNSAEAALSIGGGAALRCGHLVARLALQLSPFTFGDYKTATSVDPAFFNNHHSDSVAYRIALALDMLAVVRPPFRLGLRFTVERRADYGGDGSQYSLTLGFVVDWGNRPPGKN